jgi:hypothetical protein
MDAYIRYEHLQTDIAWVADRLSVSLPQDDLPRLKAGHRPGSHTGYRHLYGSQERDRIGVLYQDWVEKFGYRF